VEANWRGERFPTEEGAVNIASVERSRKFKSEPGFQENNKQLISSNKISRSFYSSKKIMASSAPNNIVHFHYPFSPYARRIIWYLQLRGIAHAQCVR